MDKDERNNYIENNWRKFLFLFFYFLFNVGLAVYPAVVYWDVSRKL
jgi:hypothetical protein